MRSYIIVNAYASDGDRAELSKLNGKGGIGGYNVDSKFWIGLAVTLFVAWLVIPSTWQPLSIVLFISWVGCGFHFHRNHYGPAMLVKKCGLVVTTDAEIISLDRDWLAYVGTLPEDQRHEEDVRRFVAVRRLNNTAVGEPRSEEILLLRRKLQQGE